MQSASVLRMPDSTHKPPPSQPPNYPPPVPGGDARPVPDERRASKEHRRRRSSVSDRLSAASSAVRRSISPRKQPSDEPPVPQISADRMADYTMASSLPQYSRPEIPHPSQSTSAQDRPVSPAYRRSPAPAASPSRRHNHSESFNESQGASPNRGPAMSRVQRASESRGSNGSAGSDQSSPQNPRRKTTKKSHAMLSSALRMANNAVLLDNNGEYDQAIDAYEEACNLISEAINQSETDEERRRLMEIRGSYASRVEELNQLYRDADGSNRYSTFSLRPSLDDALDRGDLAPIVETATMTRVVETDAQPELRRQAGPQPVKMPMPLAPRRPGETTESDDLDESDAEESSQQHDFRPDSYTSPLQSGPVSGLARPSNFVPGHARQLTIDTEDEFDAALDAAVEAVYMEGYEPYRMEEFDRHAQRLSHRFSLARTAQALSHTEERVIAEREAKIQAARAQVASQRKASMSSRGTAPRTAGSLTEEQENADAEERILDEFMQRQSARPESTTDILTPAGPVRQSDSSGFSGQTWGSSVASSLATAGTILSTVEETPAVLQRNQKDTPTLQETPSLGSIDAVTTSAFSPRAESQLYSNTASAPPLPASPTIPNPPHSPTVRERRMSEGKAARALKIRTPSTAGEDIPALPPMASVIPPPRSSSSQAASFLQVEDGRKPWQISSPFPSPLPLAKFDREATNDDTQPTPVPQLQSQHSTLSVATPDESVRLSPASDSPKRNLARAAAPPVLQHSASSLSLRNQSLQPSPSATTDQDPSPSTPISFAFNTLGATAGRGPMAPMNTPANFNFVPNLPPAPVAETQIFDSDLHSPSQAGMPNPEAANAPKVLEPCPEAAMLRPYWLMRCLYQTLAHPRGGYISQRLFIPREVWRAKNVKLRNVEEKISVCDLLTAALMKLASVDTYDADAVLEELQAFENILDQAQTTLGKKLGSEVGVSSVSSFFKDAPTLSSPGGANSSEASSSHAGDHSSGGTRSSSKGYFSSFRKLRSKGSSANLAGSAVSARDSGPSLTMPTVPMTSMSGVTRGFQKHQTIPDVKFIGPHGAYMGSLARLCDAVQILDQVARQVEDPGLRHSSPTHVGLELSSRHAAEFFGFYICRFILQDVILLADKYIKKANEWVNG